MAPPPIDPRAHRGKLRQMLIEEGLKPARGPSGQPILGTNGTVMNRFQRVAERIFDEAENGEAWAAQMVFDRVEGKAGTVQDAGPQDVTVLVIRGASTDDI